MDIPEYRSISMHQTTTRQPLSLTCFLMQLMNMVYHHEYAQTWVERMWIYHGTCLHIHKGDPEEEV